MEIVGKDNYCRLYLIRHGQSTANKKQITEGHLNSPLNKTGIEQAQKVAEQFREIEFDEIHSSDLLRAKQTAEIVKSERDIPIQISELLKERHFGSLEGAPWSELERQTSALDKLSKEEIWHHKLDGTMESNEEVMNRFGGYLKEIALANLQKTVLVATHGGTIGALLRYLEWPLDDQQTLGVFIGNSSYVKLKSDGTNFFVEEVVDI